MNTLRQLAARIARQCAASVACAFNAVCAMQRCCAPPSPRKFEIKFALRRIGNGILAGFAVCILVLAGLAANDAQAQTSCTGGETLINGVCTCPDGRDVFDGVCGCPTGEGIRANSTCGSCANGQEIVNGYCECPAGYVDIYTFGRVTSCRSQMLQDRIDKCRASSDDGLRVNPTEIAGIFNCQIPTRDVNFDSSTSTNNRAEEVVCVLNDLNKDDYPDIDYLLCSAVFGPNVAFPKKPSGSNPRYVFNCDPDGDNGLIPATINTIGATACTCPAGQTLQNNACACPVGQSLQYGVCIVPGVASCRGLTPATSYDSTAGACVACIAGQGVLANGTCDACPSGQGVLADGTCGACPGGQESIDGVCQCPAGTSNIKSDDDPRCYSDALAEALNKCNASGYGGTELSSPAQPHFTCAIKNLHGSFGPASGGRNAESANCTFPDAVSAISDVRLCSEIFGADFNFPQKPTDGSDPRYVFSCDPDGDNGLIPATINTIGATECACAIGGQTLQDDVCACPVGHILQDGACVACPVGHIPQDGVCAACPAGHIALNGACAVCPAGQIVLNNACAVCADGEIVYRGVCTDASVLELSGKALTLYNLLVARVTLGNVNLPAYLYSLEQFQQGILDRHNGVANYLGDLLQYETSGLYGYRPFLIDSQTAGFGNYRLSVSGEIDRILSQIPVHTSGSSSAPFGSQACQNAGWIFSADDGGSSCGVPLTLSSGAIFNRCHLSGSDSPQCSAVFGSTVNYFPSPTLSADGATLRFVYNCDPDGSKELIPATINTIGATECACLVTGAPAENGGACACPPGEGVRSDTGICGVCPAGEEVIGGFCLPGVIMNQCVTAGWSFSADGGSCGVLLTLAGGAAADKCYLSGDDSPQCAAVFGSTVNYFPSPTLSADGTTLRFVYNCDPDDENGLIPATANTILATECGCFGDTAARGGGCVPLSGNFGSLSDKVLCGAFGGTVQAATGGDEVCSGMDANDTFCIMDSAAGFPCRGLFKHLRTCNLTHNRPALNPFFCGARCGAQKAVGSKCNQP